MSLDYLDAKNELLRIQESGVRIQNSGVRIRENVAVRMLTFVNTVFMSETSS